MKGVSLAVVAGAFAVLAGALPAFAQEQTVEVDRIDRVSGAASPGGLMRPPEGVKVVSPGALIYASFDRNFDGVISMAEIETGAAGAFDVADKNGDGIITGFEQTDWAARMASAADLMANAMTFDIDLDRQVTRAEFVAGFKRLAGQINPAGDLTFIDLVRPLSRPGDPSGAGR